MLSPESVRVPEPSFVKAPSPEIMPEKVVEELSAPAARLVSAEISTLPAPAREPIESVDSAA